jgi:hypothetical protein
MEEGGVPINAQSSGASAKDGEGHEGKGGKQQLAPQSHESQDKESNK